MIPLEMFEDTHESIQAWINVATLANAYLMLGAIPLGIPDETRESVSKMNLLGNLLTPE